MPTSKSRSKERRRKPEPEYVPEVPVGPEQICIAGGNMLSERITKFYTSSMPGTFVYSPFLVRALVGQAELGALGPSAEEIPVGLQFTEGHATFTKAHAKLWEELQATNASGNILLEAHMFCLKQGFEITKEFTTKLATSYNTEVTQCDFTDSAFTATLINSWFMAAMNNHIREVIQPKLISLHTRILLLSTVYFGGEWKEKFERKLTKKLPFHVKPTKSVEVAMMSKKGNVLYAEFKNLDATAIALPYMGDRLFLIVVLPKVKHDLARLRKDMPSASLARRIVGMTNVHIQLPRFSIESEVHLIPALQNVGIKTMFDPFQSNFSGITGFETSALFVSEIIQKVRIDVSEHLAPLPAEPAKKKSRFAPLSLGKNGKGKSKTPQFNANHPFVFQIVDKTTNLVVFAGTCTNPLKLCSLC